MMDEEHLTANLLRLAGRVADPPGHRVARVKPRCTRRGGPLRAGGGSVASRGMIVPGVAASLGIAAWLEWSRPTPPPPHSAWRCLLG